MIPTRDATCPRGFAVGTRRQEVCSIHLDLVALYWGVKGLWGGRGRFVQNHESLSRDEMTFDEF